MFATCMDDVVLIDEVITGSNHKAPPNLKDLRIGIPKNHFFSDLEPKVAQICETTIKLLKKSGCTLVENDEITNLSEASLKKHRDLLFLQTVKALTDYIKKYSKQALSNEQLSKIISSPDVDLKI